MPVLLVHGDDDIQVMVDQSQRMARALEHRRQEARSSCIIKDGNHSLSRYEWRKTLLTKLEAFLAANIHLRGSRPTTENAGRRGRRP